MSWEDLVDGRIFTTAEGGFTEIFIVYPDP
jgi:hypothetical protein